MNRKRTLAFNPSLHIATQSSLDCSDAVGLVSSILSAYQHEYRHISLLTHVVDAKLIQCLRNLDLLLGVKEGIGKLFAFPQCALNDLEARHVAQEIAHRSVGVLLVRMRVLLGSYGGVSGMCCIKMC